MQIHVVNTNFQLILTTKSSSMVRQMKYLLPSVLGSKDTFTMHLSPHQHFGRSLHFGTPLGLVLHSDNSVRIRRSYSSFLSRYFALVSLGGYGILVRWGSLYQPTLSIYRFCHHSAIHQNIHQLCKVHTTSSINQSIFTTYQPPCFLIFVWT